MTDHGNHPKILAAQVIMVANGGSFVLLLQVATRLVLTPWKDL
jgi:hypothetical protein